jgi:hypothetical protein
LKIEQPLPEEIRDAARTGFDSLTERRRATSRARRHGPLALEDTARHPATEPARPQERMRSGPPHLGRRQPRRNRPCARLPSPALRSLVRQLARGSIERVCQRGPQPRQLTLQLTEHQYRRCATR